jgi:hypothetical protein
MSCEALLELELTVTPRPEYPDELMDESTFTLAEGARGTAQRDLGGVIELVIEEASVVAETRLGGSRSSYTAGFGAFIGETMEIQGTLSK